MTAQHAYDHRVHDHHEPPSDTVGRGLASLVRGIAGTRAAFVVLAVTVALTATVQAAEDPHKMGAAADVEDTASGEGVAAGADTAADGAASLEGVHPVAGPFLTQWCIRCHGPERRKGGLDLIRVFADRQPDSAIVREIRDRLADGDMPPENAPQPPSEERRRALAWAESVLADEAERAGPGRVTARRLSRSEYVRTIRDLLGVDCSDLVATFPTDDLGYGFDNIGDTMSLSVLHIEKYAAAAEKIAARAIVVEDPDNPTVRRFTAASMESSLGPRSIRGDSVSLYSRGSVMRRVKFPRDGEYLIRVLSHGDQAGDEPPRMQIRLDDDVAATFDVPEQAREAKFREVRVRATAGSHRVAAAFVNDYYRPETREDRNLIVHEVEVIGPVDAPVIPAGHRWIFARDPGRGSVFSRARLVVHDMATRAWRRPVEWREIGPVIDLVANAVERGDPFAAGCRLGLQAILLSPHFLFRIEPGGTRGKEGKSELLGDVALASRLSYFLWSSMPDQRLLDLAGRKRLRDLEVLAAETRRMLADERSFALADNFAAQWLELRNLADVAPDPDRFPDFDDDLRRAMRTETELFVDAVLREKRDLYDLLDADFTFVNDRLARHYGMELAPGEGFRRVALSDARRGGLVAQASIHTVTSNPTRTSPVKRGKWVLENLLDAPPPPPPPGVDSLDEGDGALAAATLRQRMEAHRADPQCASCHTRMDALGFALENYDPIGRWRDRDGELEIDASGVLPDGQEIRGPVGLKRVLARDPAFALCVAKKMFVYAVGRMPGERDRRDLDALVAALPAETPTLEDLIVGIVRMDAFRMRSITR